MQGAVRTNHSASIKQKKAGWYVQGCQKWGRGVTDDTPSTGVEMESQGKCDHLRTTWESTPLASSQILFLFTRDIWSEHLVLMGCKVRIDLETTGS
jgi:hypothetical protein